MACYIERQKLLELFENDDDVFKSQDIRHIIKSVKPAAETKSGYWTLLHPEWAREYRHYQCSACKMERYDANRFCPHCGANMMKDGKVVIRDENDKADTAER